MTVLKPASITSIFLNILILYIQVNPAFPDLLCHGQKNSTLMKQVLNIESGNKVPEYEIIQLRILSKRSADDQNVIRVYLSAFGKDIQLRLQRNDDFNDNVKNAKFFNAKLTDTGVQLAEVIVEDDDPGTPYIDPAQMAAIIIRHGPHGELQMDGLIGVDLLIKPAPMDINFLGDSFLFDRDFSDESGDRFDSCGKDANNSFGHSSSARTKRGVHIVYRRPMKSETSLKVPQEDVIENFDSTDDRRHHKRPLHAWPEVLLIVDYDSYLMHLSYGFNDTQIRRYYISFFHGVDLRYKVLTDPKISLVLSGIIVASSRDATPYLKNNLLRVPTVFEASKAVEDLSRYLYSVKMDQPSYPEFDVAVLVTKLNMCTQRFFICDPTLAGIASFMGACNVSHEQKRWNGVTIVEDQGGFDGVFTAAHEIGHLFGLTHDGDRYSSQGVLQTFVCSKKGGYIMSPHLGTGRVFEWSDCSIKQFRHFLSSENAACLLNQPSYPSISEGSVLPGEVLSLDEQCRRIWGTRANASDSRVCGTLQCHKPTVGFMKMIHLPDVLPPAAEGSSCGEDLRCRYGKCVSKYLTYSQAWNMAPVPKRLEITIKKPPTVSTTRRPPTVSTTRRPPTVSTTRRPPTVSTTRRPPSMKEECTEDKADSFCRKYIFVIGRQEPCKNNRLLQGCCNLYKIICNIRYS